MTKTKTRRLQGPEFKSEAAKLVVEKGLTLAEAARDLDDLGGDGDPVVTPPSVACPRTSSGRVWRARR